MPSRKDLPIVARRFGRGLTATVLVPLAACRAFADHGVLVPQGGFGWMSWLLVGGAVVAVALAAWAFFAPDREPDHGGAPKDPTSPVEPPSR